MEIDMIKYNHLIKLLVLIAISFLASTCKSTYSNNDNQCNYKLVLSYNDNFKATVGNGIIVYLSLQNDDLELLNKTIIEDLEGENLGGNVTKIKGAEFLNQVNIKATKTGKYTLGPYKLQIGNCELVSNTIDIIVHDKPEVVSPEFTYSSLKIELKKFEEKEFFITTNFELEFNKDIKNHGFEIYPGSTSMNTAIVSGILKRTNKYSFKIVAKQVGKYKLTKEYFNHLPSTLEFEELELEIKE
jgi:hypothetical protein